MLKICDEILHECSIIPRTSYTEKLDNNTELDCDYQCIILHHAGDSFSKNSTPAELLDEHADGMPYHFIIDYFGRIYEGRSLSYKGEHTKNANSRCVGICFLGDYAPPEESSFWDMFSQSDEIPSEESKKSLEKLIQVLCSKFNITYLCGHREMAELVKSIKTACPGANLMPIVNEMRKVFNLKKPTNNFPHFEGDCL